MNHISILDCTLRDGGWVQNFCFGEEAMQDILYSTEGAGIRCLEIGYLNQKSGTMAGRSMYASPEAIGKNGLQNHKKKGALHFVMIDYGKYDIASLPFQGEESFGIDGIRLCFHKEDLESALAAARAIKDKGYHLFLQPMVTTRYSDEEFLALISRAQDVMSSIEAFYIVDSFGVMDPDEAAARVCLADRALSPETILGVHFHNNQDQAFENAKASCEAVRAGRHLQVDTTLFGIGKGAGNLDTASFAGYLNEHWGNTYDRAALEAVSRRRVLPLKDTYRWGFYPEYALTAKYRMTPSYAGVFYRENHLSLEEMEEILSQMPEDKKDSFNRGYAEAALKEYKEAGRAAHKKAGKKGSGEGMA